MTPTDGAAGRASIRIAFLCQGAPLRPRPEHVMTGRPKTGAFRPSRLIRWLETLASGGLIGAAVSGTLDGFDALERRIRWARDMRAQRRGSDR